MVPPFGDSLEWGAPRRGSPEGAPRRGASGTSLCDFVAGRLRVLRGGRGTRRRASSRPSPPAARPSTARVEGRAALRRSAKRRGPAQGPAESNGKSRAPAAAVKSEALAEGLLLHDFLALVQALGPGRSGSPSPAPPSQLHHRGDNELELHLDDGGDLA